MLQKFTQWLRLVLLLREPTEEEKIREARIVARKLRPYDARLARELEIQADRAEADMECRPQ